MKKEGRSKRTRNPNFVTEVTLISPSPPPSSGDGEEEKQLSDFPIDVILEILSRPPLDLEFITRLKLVSKSFRKMIEDPLVTETITTIAAKEPGVLTLSHDNVTGSTTFYYARDEHNVKAVYRAPFYSQDFKHYLVESYCNGLVCFCRYDVLEQVFICNPLTREHVVLPGIARSSSPPVYALGCSRSSSNKEYKVLRVFNVARRRRPIRPKVYTLGTSSWRSISSFPNHVFYGKTVFAYGALHWKIDPFYHDGPACMDRIISFDVDKEEFYITKHPEELGELWKNDQINLIQLGESLAIADVSFTTHIDIWVLQDSIDKLLWVKECVLKFEIPEHPKQQVSYQWDRQSMTDFNVIGFWQQGDILIARNRQHNLQFYDPLSWNEDLFYSYDGKTEHIREVNNIIQTSPSTTITRVCGYSRSLLSLKPYGGTVNNTIRTSLSSTTIARARIYDYSSSLLSFKPYGGTKRAITLKGSAKHGIKLMLLIVVFSLAFFGVFTNNQYMEENI